MIVTYVPDLEDVATELTPHLWSEPDLARKVVDILKELAALGYEVSRQVDVSGDMERALRTLNDGGSAYVKRGRPERH